MGDFFHGWRRMFGCLTLVMALTFMGGWVRSYYREDGFEFCPGRSILCASSGYGFFLVTRATFPSHNEALSVSLVQLSPLKSLNIGWSSGVIPGPLNEIEPWKDAQSESHWKWCGFISGTASYTTINQHFDKGYVLLPYWSLTIPLTLISFWLLLSKPHRSIQKKISEPIPVE